MRHTSDNKRSGVKPGVGAVQHEATPGWTGAAGADADRVRVAVAVAEAAAPGGAGAVLVAVAPGGGVGVLTAVAPGGDVGVLTSVAPGGGVGVLVAVAPGGGVGVLVAVAPGGGVGVLVAVAPGGGVGVLVAEGVAVAPTPGRVGVGVNVGTVWKSGAWVGNAQTPGMTARSPRTNRPTTAVATARAKGKRLLEVKLRGDGIGYCPVAGR